jgi:hypothetical protein
MPEQIFQLVERNLEARQITAENMAEVAAWVDAIDVHCKDDDYIEFGPFGDIHAHAGQWFVRLFDDYFIVVEDADFRKHFTNPRLPWHPMPPMPHWYRGPSFTDGPPLTINAKP